MPTFDPTRSPAGRLARLGIVLDAAAPDDSLRLARLCDRAGIEAVWIADRVSLAGQLVSGSAWAVAGAVAGHLGRSRLGVIVDGRLRQFATPNELVDRPAGAFVASFTGANLLHGRVEGHEDGLTRVRLQSGELVYSTDEAGGEGGVGVYPWDVSVGRVHADDSALNLIHGEVTSVVRVGNRVRVRIGPLAAEVTERSAARLELARGGTALASFKATGTKLVPL